MITLIWCFDKLEKSTKVDESFIFPCYGMKVNEFNEFLMVSDVEHKGNIVRVKLKRF